MRAPLDRRFAGPRIAHSQCPLMNPPGLVAPRGGICKNLAGTQGRTRQQKNAQERNKMDVIFRNFAISLRGTAGGAALIALMALSTPALAVTPADTLVEGFAIDDIISMDPAEAFEFSTAEVTANSYNLLVRLDLNDTSKVKGDLAESWTVSDDGLTYTFKLKPGLKFASGNPITAADVAYSFERAVKLNKSPGFIITQLGIDGDNVAEKAKAVDDGTFQLIVD